MALVLDAYPFKAYIQSQKAGWSMRVKSQSVIHPGLVMDDDLRAEAPNTGANPDDCVPQFQITGVVRGKIVTTYDDGYGIYTLERGSTPSRLLIKADFTMVCPEDTIFYCIFPQEPDPICYRRKAVLLAANGSVTITAKPCTQHLWVAEGEVAGHNAPALLTIPPNEERVLQSASGMLGCLLWHESK